MVYQEIMGKNYPAMTCIVVQGLVEIRALVEIEVTAVKPHDSLSSPHESN